MANGKIEYNIEVPFDVVENNAVGPTTDTALRPNSSLPNTLSTGGADINTIYLDEAGGNDANSGFTFALAKATWAAALAVTSAARPTIHIQTSTGTDSQLTETLGSTTAFPADLLNVQVEAGQTAKLILNDFGYTTGAAAEPKVFNGFEIVTNTANTDPIIAGIDPGSSVQLFWCRFEAQETVLSNGAISSITPNDSIICSRSLSSTISPSINLPASLAFFPVNSIFEHRNSQATNSTLVNLNGVFAPANCVFTGYENVMFKVGVLGLYVVADCIIHKCTNIFNTTSVTFPSVAEIKGSLMNVTALHSDPALAELIVISDAGNRFNQDPLFIDEVNRDFRLVHVGRTVNGIPFPINSPAVGIGTAGIDAGAFNVTYTPQTAALKTLTYADHFGFDSVEMSLIRSNYQGFDDIQGRFHNTWDDVQYEIKFKLAKDYHVGNSFAYEFAAMFRDKGVKRFYPYGDDGLFGSAITLSVIDATNIDFTTNLPDVTQVDGSGAVQEDLGINAFTGWIVVITWTDSGAKTGFFEIISNTATALELEHIRGDSDITSGSGFAGNILYLPVQVAMKSLSLDSEYYSEDDNTGTGNDDNKPFHRKGFESSENTQNAEFHTRTWTLRQTREEPS